MNKASVWTGIGKSVLGNSHKRQNKPNQDAFAFLPESGSGNPIVLAIADGHGSNRAFRSHIGSRLAVEKVSAILLECLAKNSAWKYPAIHEFTKQELPECLIKSWNEAIRYHLESNPFNEEEQQLLLTEDEAGKQRTHPQPTGKEIQTIINRYPYGTTLLAVVVTDNYIMYLQLGDGDILCVSDRGEVYRPFLTRDERLIGNETTSMCQLDAWREFRIAMKHHTEDSPVAILVSTDGYSNSFVTEEDFLKVGSDFYQWIMEVGLAEVKAQLESVLTEATEKGSGDDITLGILSRIRQ